MSLQPLAMRAERAGDVVRLKSPGVGTFSCAAARGSKLSAGESAGVLTTLGRAFELVVPEGADGIVRSHAPELAHAPVGFGALLYEIATRTEAAPERAKSASAVGGALVFRSPQSGRFWHRTAPGEPALVAEGAVIASGAAIGVIEVMKTFTLVHYVASGTLPAKARILRVLASDGAEVAETTVLFELAPA